MLTQAKRAWILDKLHGFFVKKVPNLVRTIQILEAVMQKQKQHLLDDSFRAQLNTVKQKAFPYVLAYLAGCCAPAKRPRRRTVHSS